jgi:DNA-binding NtrC family response regulator
MKTLSLSAGQPIPTPAVRIQVEGERTTAATAKREANAQLVLVLTRDRSFERMLSEALRDAVVLKARDASEVLQIISGRGGELDLAVIDFDQGCHGMTLLSAIKSCFEKLPIVVVVSSDTYHAAALAYANGAAACVAKPVTGAELEIVLQQLREPKLKLTDI